ncbi:putative ABC transport system permease protein [Desulfotomaculum arcticum]|uniref:Putative ABC transport system permease protein n=1 Tax=Desulfotruncus arcticus DSM 17038 TaxID=1121424 RepID=A0A1I2WA39_9FIRM|nr:ABC transporter permease [Desulfotruncus arcticus]SFG98162.1 putative ABC transport system permease protein [Desulfotomaculum arcticum] [Desulfotruncus arcticus DSM 17038]
MAAFLVGPLELGLLWGVMVLGVYLTFRILDFPDLTVDGSFTLGAAVAAHMIITGYDPWLGTLLAILCGAIAGSVTGFLHTQLKITPLLAGILSMIALYSVNLRIMGKSMISLLRMDTIFTNIVDLGVSKQLSVLILGLAAVIVVIFLLYLFLETELGLALRATGDNEQMIRSLGVNTNTMKVIGLSLSNALIAFSGAMIAQKQGFADVGMGIGMIIVGLASVIIGEVLIGNNTLLKCLTAVVIGSIVYRLVIAVVLQLGLAPTDLKLFTAVLVALALSSPVLKSLIAGSTGVARGKGEKNAGC